MDPKPEKSKFPMDMIYPSKNFPIRPKIMGAITLTSLFTEIRVKEIIMFLKYQL